MSANGEGDDRLGPNNTRQSTGQKYASSEAVSKMSVEQQQMLRQLDESLKHKNKKGKCKM